MILLDGQWIKGADDICDGCKHPMPCPAIDMIEAIVCDDHCEITACGCFEELLP